MSVQATNSSKFQEFHGIKLANGAAIANLVIEKLVNDPLTPESGRFWYNTTENGYKFVKNGVVETVTSVEDLAAAMATLQAEYADAEGSSLVGFVGAVGSNSKFTIVEGTLEAAVSAIVNAVDAEIKNREDADTSAAASLASQTIDSSGSSLVGFDGKAGANGVITVAAGTVADSLDSIVEQVDSAFSSLGDDAVSKTTLEDQTIASNLRILKDVVIDGNVTINGTNTMVTGDTVSLGDNIILLNGELAPDAEPTMAAGWQVNRGIHGTLDSI